MSETKPNRPGRFLKKKRDTGIRLAIPFLLTLGLLTVVSFILPLRPTVSELEKRELASFPEFSVEALISGTYFDDISTWFSDTFPGRESWLRLSTNLQSLHGSSDISISGNLPVVETIPPITEAPEVLLQAEPEPSEETLAPTVATEATVPETTEENPEELGNQAIQDISDTPIIHIGDSAYNALSFSENASKRMAASIGAYADTMKERGIRVVSAPAPTAVGVRIDPQYLEQLHCANQKDMLQYIHGLMSDNAIKIDTHAALSAHKDEYIYFRTDHHWTARGAYYVYEAVCNALGLTPTPLEDFREWDMGEFEGSLMSKVSRPQKLKLDTLYAYVTDDDVTMTIYSNEGNWSHWDMISDMTDQSRTAKYGAFLRNDNPITVLENNDLPEGTACILVKDSFGNCLAPFFTQNYHTVYVIDYRKYFGSLNHFMETHPGVQDIIFAPYMIATQSEAGNDLFRKMCS